METWGTVVVFELVSERHHEQILWAANAQRLAALAGEQPLRARLADVLVRLAARLDQAAPTGAGCPASA
jgi:hypothetical protein